MKIKAKMKDLIQDGVTVSRNAIEVGIFDKEGELAEGQTDIVARAIMERLHWGAFKTGYGGWIIRPDIELDGFDYCDKASKHHR